MTSEQQLSGKRSLFFLILIYLAFFASGASALSAEVTWNRMLITVVGNSMSATAMIIVVFMGGLGLGSYYGGKFFGKRRPSLAPYVWMEIAIGVYVLISPWLFELLSQLFSSSAEIVNHRAGLTLVRIVVTLGALLLPALLMGATFPAMISGAAPDSPFKRTGRTGFLYSMNTLGAALGCLVAGRYLVFEYGVQTTLMFACGLNLIAATSAFLANIFIKPQSQKIEPAPMDIPMADLGMMRFLGLATFGIGFVALAYEVLLTRVGILYLGNVASVFSLVLAAFLLGTGISAILGTWLYGALHRHTKQANKLFGFIALAAGAAVISTPYFILTLKGASADQFVRNGIGAVIDSYYGLLGVIVAPTILIGALLPIAIRMVQYEGRRQATQSAANLYALNTAGGLLGAGVANHLLIPALGLQGVLIFLTAICAALGVVSLLGSAKSLPRWRWIATASGIAVLALVLANITPDLKLLYAKEIAKSLQAQSSEVLLVHEGKAANVVVLDVVHSRKEKYRDMLLNGVEEASTRFWHTQLFKLLGTLPVMVHASDGPKEALVIAFGAGITAGSVLAADDIASLDVVDLNPDIEGINNLFTEVNGDVFHKPRFTFHNDDGRNYLVTSSKQYDVIISDSTHPRSYDSWVLYTREFYQSVKRRLRPGGLFAQWVPVDGTMRGRLIQIHLNTFKSVFPNTTLWYVYGSDQAFLLGTPEPLVLDAARLQRKLDRLPAWFQAEYYQIDTIERLAGFFWMDTATMTRMISTETRINADDLNYFGNKSAIRPLARHQRLHRFHASVQPYLKNVDNTLWPSIKRQQLVADLTAVYRFANDPRSLVKAYCMMPDNRSVQYWMNLQYSKEVLNYEHFCK